MGYNMIKNKLNLLIKNINNCNNTLDLYYYIDLLIDLLLYNDNIYNKQINLIESIIVNNNYLRSNTNNNLTKLIKELLINDINNLKY